MQSGLAGRFLTRNPGSAHMGLLTTLFSRSLENPSTPLSAPDDWLFDSLGSFRASSGVNVNRETALTYDAYWRCVALISGDVAKLPLCVYERQGKGKAEAEAHPAYRLLMYEACPDVSALDFKRVLSVHALTEGNGYAYIQRDGAGRPLELWPLSPMKTYPVRANTKLWYVTEVGREPRRLAAEDVFHLKGLSFDGLVGYSAVAKMRETLGLGLAAQNFGSIFFRNNARPNVILKHPGKLKPEAKTNLRESWERMHSGLENAHRTAVLEEGMDLVPLMHNARDSQLLELRGFNRIEVCNFFGVPPHKVGDSSRTSYNSLEQENEAYVDDGGGLGFWLPQWCSEAWRKLLTEEEKAGLTHFFAFKLRQLLRANLSARTAYYVAMVSNGILSPNEVRDEEGYNPREGGDDYLTPLNMNNGSEDPSTDEEDNSEESKSLPAGLLEAQQAVLADALGRMARRLGAAARRAAKKPASFLASLDALAQEHGAVIAEATQPALAAARLTGGAVVDERQLARELVDGFRTELLRIAGESTPATLEANVASLCQRLEVEQPQTLTAWVYAARAKPNKASRTVEQACDILDRLPDADDEGRVAVTMPVTDDIDWQSWGVTPEAMAQDYQEKPVKLRKLIATRALVIRKRVRAFIEDPDQDPDPDGDDKELLGELPTDCPWVVEKDGEKYIYDGHHRLMARQLLGMSRVQVYYYKAD